MNNQNFLFYQDHYYSEEKNGSCSDRTFKEMADEIELLREQVESLKSLLEQECRRTDEYRQEVMCLNHELEQMNMELCYLTTSILLPIHENNNVNKRRKKTDQSGSVSPSESMIIIDIDRVKKLN